MTNVQYEEIVENTIARSKLVSVINVSQHWILPPVAGFFLNTEIMRSSTWNA